MSEKITPEQVREYARGSEEQYGGPGPMTLFQLADQMDAAELALHAAQAELKLNASMLARQCDLARDAEAKVSTLSEALERVGELGKLLTYNVARSAREAGCTIAYICSAALARAEVPAKSGQDGNWNTTSPDPKDCNHEFVGSNRCAICGWYPPKLARAEDKETR